MRSDLTADSRSDTSADLHTVLLLVHPISLLVIFAFFQCSVSKTSNIFGPCFTSIKVFFSKIVIIAGGDPKHDVYIKVNVSLYSNG